uniref:cell envelope biogenesis protein OmpA n=1 Tax=Scandinavium goeteborgense TaxID=1851514 RepID=UPI00135C745C|nr:cell envelope biogenesis protein OmpA [Scandinavium goeteborgense]
MKNVLKAAIGIALVSLSASSFAQSYEGYPDIPGTTVGYATQVMDYQPGPGVGEDYQHTEDTLGQPNYYTEGNSFALGQGGSLVLAFTPFEIKPSGTSESDFYVYEVNTYEPWDAYVSNDMINWVKATPSFSDTTDESGGSKGRGSVVGYDIDAISPTTNYKYVKIVDTSNSTFTNTAGSDIDAVLTTSGQYTGGGTIVDTDSRNGMVFNLEKDKATGAVDVKKISKDGSVEHIMFSEDDSLDPIALSVQGNFDCDDAKDINVLATRKSDDVPVNIIKDQQGNDIATIDNSITN